MTPQTRQDKPSKLARLRNRLAVEISDRLLASQEFLYWTYIRYQRLTSAFILGALDPQGHRELTTRVYSRQKRMDKPGVPTGLAPWERQLVSHLPRPPAKILVGGCGDGREARELAAMGYHVTAFDPIARFIERARVKNHDNVEYLVGSYEDLVESQAQREGSLAAILEQKAPFDAVYLGWGSFSHVPLGPTRSALLQKLRELSPSGPIVLSYVPDTKKGAPNSKARQFVITWAACLFGRGRPAVTQADRIFFRGGFVHAFSTEDLAALASAAGSHLAATLRDPTTHYEAAIITPIQ